MPVQVRPLTGGAWNTIGLAAGGFVPKATVLGVTLRTGLQGLALSALQQFVNAPSAGTARLLASARLAALGLEAMFNTAPVASLTVTPTGGLAVSAVASATTDAEANITQYRFVWGDATGDTVQAGHTAPHTYAGAGTYTVTVTATDAGGLTGTDTKQVTV